MSFFDLFRSGKKAATPKPSAPEPAPAPAPVAAPATPAPAPATHIVKKYEITGTQYYESAWATLIKPNPAYTNKKQEIIKRGLTNQKIYKYSITPTSVQLVPEPDNQYDPNAIKVLINGAHVGYVKAGSCAHLLKMIYGGKILSITCQTGGGDYVLLEQYGPDDFNYINDTARYWASIFVDEDRSKK